MWSLLELVFTLNVLSLDVQRNHALSETKSDLPFQLADHIQNNCPRAVIQCPYCYIGCNVEVYTLNFSIFYTFLKHTHIAHSHLLVLFSLYPSCTPATSFPGFSPTRLTERVGENPGNEVVLQPIQFSFVIFHVCYICTYTTTVTKNYFITVYFFVSK